MGANRAQSGINEFVAPCGAVLIPAGIAAIAVLRPIRH